MENIIGKMPIHHFIQNSSKPLLLTKAYQDFIIKVYPVFLFHKYRPLPDI